RWPRRSSCGTSAETCPGRSTPRSSPRAGYFGSSRASESRAPRRSSSSDGARGSSRSSPTACAFSCAWDTAARRNLTPRATARCARRPAPKRGPTSTGSSRRTSSCAGTARSCASAPGRCATAARSRASARTFVRGDPGHNLGVKKRFFAFALALALLLVAMAFQRPLSAQQPPLPSPFPAPSSDEPAVLIGVGDIADCAHLDEARKTAEIVDKTPGTVFTLGDHAYPDGTTEQFANRYGPTWGRFKSRTRPAVGNHDYHTPGAGPYFAYFGKAAGDPTKGYYSYELGDWHVIVVNSNCKEVGGCNRGSPQERW